MKKFIADFLSEWKKYNINIWAGALTFYLFLSFVPMVIILAFLTRFFSEGVIDLILSQLQLISSSRAGDFAKEIVLSSRLPSAGLAAILSIVVLFASSLNAFNIVQNAMNAILEEKIKGMKAFFLRYAISFLFVATSFIFMLAIVIFKPVLYHLITISIFIKIANYLLQFFVFAFLLSLFYRILPRKKIRWKTIFFGGIFGTLLLFLVDLLASFYFRYASIESVYGVAGSMMIILLWTFLSVNALLAGFLFTKLIDARKAEN